MEIELIINPIANHEPPERPSQLYHFLGFEQNELAALQTKYGKTVEELEEIVKHYPKALWWYRINNYITLYGSCGLFLIFPIRTSNEGIITFARVIKSDAIVPDNLGYVIGGTLSVIEALFYMCVFSGRKEAIRSVLAYAAQKPLRTTLAETIDYAKKNPGYAAISFISTLTNHSILIICNATGVMTELIYIPLDYTKPQFLIVAGIVQIYGYEYYRKYMNDDYFAGLDFWRNTTKRPWLLQEMLKGHICLPLQVMLQGASCIGLRAYPYFYFLAVASDELLGYWIDPKIVSALIVWHSLCVLYPSSFNYYMADKESLLTSLQNNIDVQQVASELGLDLNRVCESVLKTRVKNFVEENGGQLKIIKQEPLSVFLVASFGALGLALGYGLGEKLSQYMNNEGALFLMMSSSAILLGGTLYRAEVARISYKRLQEASSTIETKPKILYSKKTIIAAVILNWCSALETATSHMGTLQPLIGDGSPDITAFIALLSIEVMLNSILFNQEKVKNTVKDMLRPLPTVSEFCGSFFNKFYAKPQAEDNPQPPKKSWCG